MGKISDGIHKRIEKMIHSGEEQPRHNMIISDDNKDLFCRKNGIHINN